MSIPTEPRLVDEIGSIQPIRQPVGRPFETDKSAMTLLAAAAIGAALGAGLALMFAPASGHESRASIARGVRRLTGRERGVWENLDRALRKARKERLKAKAAKAAASAAVAGADVIV